MQTQKRINHYGRLPERFKHVLFSFLLFIICCGMDECSGVGSPPPPSFQMSYSREANGKTKFYFIPSEGILIQKIEINANPVTSGETINFDYPYLVCNYLDKHLLKEFDNVQAGQNWVFTFIGVSQNTGNNFSTVKTITIK